MLPRSAVRSAILAAAVLAALLTGMVSSPARATPTGTLVVTVASSSTIYAEVVSGQDLLIVNADVTSRHTVSTSIGGATVNAAATVSIHVTASVGTVAFGTVDGTTPVVITVL